MDQEPVYWSAAMPERVSNRQEIPGEPIPRFRQQRPLHACCRSRSSVALSRPRVCPNPCDSRQISRLFIRTGYRSIWRMQPVA